MFDTGAIRAELMRLAHADKLGKGANMMSRWDAYGAFIDGARFQYDIDTKEVETLRRLVADVLLGFLPEDTGPGFDWDEWAALATKELGLETK